MYATMADAHREWHRNTGIPVGTPGCPQDACHLPDDYDEQPVAEVEGTLFYTTGDAARHAQALAAARGTSVKVTLLR